MKHDLIFTLLEEGGKVADLIEHQCLRVCSVHKDLADRIATRKLECRGLSLMPLMLEGKAKHSREEGQTVLRIYSRG